jgi:PKD repeat protein
MRKLIFVFSFFLGVSQSIIAQSQITGLLTGLLTPDSAIVRVQKSNIEFHFVKIYGNAGGTAIPFSFNNLSNGSWALSIDAPGYTYPPATVVALNNNTQNRTLQITQSTGGNFLYQWQDDSSFVGHAQQSYINTPLHINVLGSAQPIPYDFNAINILNEYGFLLSNDSTTWTSEDAFRLYVMLGKLNFPKFGENDSVFVRAKWHITNRAIDRDIAYTSQSNVSFITVSRQAFTYATPLVVTVDGVRGKFFSKRLFNAVVYYYTDRGTRGHLINEIASTRYGLTFLAPSPQLQTLMSETSTNFQEFTADEKLIILSMFEEFPDAMQRQASLKYLVRRINGMPNPTYPSASAVAWVSNENIEFMESAFASQSIDFMQRLVLHEKAHFLWEHSFDNTTKNDWATLGGWYLDPTQASGWSTTNTTEFVSAYAHLSNPNEDMAESISFYITNPDALRSRSMRKFEFIRDRIMQGTRYVAIINPNMTFQVYNLFPDYNYPGKIKRSEVQVLGAPTEDKTIIIEIELNTMNNVFNGADFASARLFSSIGTFKDIQLNKINPQGSILRGQMTLSKRAKSGYWTIPQMAIYDQARNARLEKSTTFGILVFVNNPMEDVAPPLYVQNSLTLDSLGGKFIDFSGRTASEFCGACADTLPTIPALKVKFDIIEQNTINPDGRAYATVFFPTLDSVGPYNMQPYSQGIQINGPGIQNDLPDSLKRAQFYFPVPDYMPRGYYSISSLLMTDLALNTRMVLLDNDTGNTNFFVPPRFINQRALRDSVYFNTPYPDLKPPVLDLNDIQIIATPTNPTAPNGETLFEMWVWVKDTSDYPGHESGFATLYYTLRDPQGLEHQMSADGTSVPGFWIFPDSTTYGWHRYKVTSLLPIGSPPGLWGVSQIVVQDRARNKKYYSFVEFVRFDVEASTVLQVTPFVQIIDGSVNANNVDSISVRIGCPGCQNQTYRLRMYSNMGGAVPIFEGPMTADTIQLNNINLTGVNDGNLFATVFMLDSIRALIGTGRAQYLKDTQIPNVVVNRSARSNLTDTILVTANERITNTLSPSSVSVTNGTVANVIKLTPTTFRLIINRSCADSLSVSLLPGALLDTVGNPNAQANFSVVDTLLPPRPSAVASGNLSFCFGDSVVIQTQALNGLDLRWKLNGTVITGETGPNLVVRNSGIYTAEFVGTNGCVNASTPITVNVYAKPTVDFVSLLSSQCLTGNSFSFTNSSTITSGTLTHLWSFGDGGTASSFNATKTYGSAGTYSVKLVSTSNNGCKDSTTQQVVVNPMPSTAYSINTAAQCLTGNSFSFTNSSAIASGTLTHLWSFGDGGTASSFNATKTYGSAGTYSVKLVSTSNNGCKDSTTRQVTVHPMPVAGFTVSPAIQCLTGNSFSFTNNSTVSGGTTTSNWTFGNGSTSTSQNPTNSYSNVGAYTVKLISTSNNGCKDSTTRDVRVDPSPTATLSISPYRSIHPGLLTTISATVTPAGNYKYTWYRDNQLVPTETTTIVDSIGYRLWSGSYKMTLENLSPLLACAYTTTDLIVGDSVSTKLFIYPNPSNGLFRVTYYSPTNTRYQVVVMDTKGAVLYRKPHEVTNRYQLIDINLTGTSRGLYILQIQDPTGKQLATGKLVIQ